MQQAHAQAPAFTAADLVAEKWLAVLCSIPADACPDLLAQAHRAAVCCAVEIVALIDGAGESDGLAMQWTLADARVREIEAELTRRGLLSPPRLPGLCDNDASGIERRRHESMTGRDDDQTAADLSTRTATLEILTAGVSAVALVAIGESRAAHAGQMEKADSPTEREALTRSGKAAEQDYTAQLATLAAFAVEDHGQHEDAAALRFEAEARREIADGLRSGPNGPDPAPEGRDETPPPPAPDFKHDAEQAARSFGFGATATLVFPQQEQPAMSGTNPDIVEEQRRRSVAPGGNDYTELRETHAEVTVAAFHAAAREVTGRQGPSPAVAHDDTPPPPPSPSPEQAKAKQPEQAPIMAEAEPQPEPPANRQPHATPNRAVAVGPGQGGNVLYEYIADGKGQSVEIPTEQDPRAAALATFNDAFAIVDAAYGPIDDALQADGGRTGGADWTKAGGRTGGADWTKAIEDKRAAELARDNAVRDYIAADLGPAPAFTDKDALSAYQGRIEDSLNAAGLDSKVGVSQYYVAAEYGLEMSEADRRGLRFNETEALINLPEGPGMLETEADYLARCAAAPAAILAGHIDHLALTEAQDGLSQQDADILAMMRTAQQPALALQNDEGPTPDELWTKAAHEAGHAQSAREQAADRIPGAENSDAEARPMSRVERFAARLADMQAVKDGSEPDHGKDKDTGRGWS